MEIDETILAHFDGNTLALREWTAEEKASFCSIASAVHEVGLDWYNVDLPQIRFGRRSPENIRARGLLGQISRDTNGLVLRCEHSYKDLGLTGTFQFTQESATHFAEMITRAKAILGAWKSPSVPRKGYWPDEVGIAEESPKGARIRNHVLERHIMPARNRGDSNVTVVVSDIGSELGLNNDWIIICQALEGTRFQEFARVNAPSSEGPKFGPSRKLTFALSEGATPVAQAKHYPTNLILYGPPGTGKTYRTAREAVKLCDGGLDPAFDETEEGRKALMGRYNELKDENRIGFVTFHQNYDYETFVEGLRPETGAAEGPSAGFRLVPQSGIFRDICALANQSRTRTTPTARTTGYDFSGRQFWKMAQGAIGQDDDVYDDAIANGYIALGWGGSIDWAADEFSNRDAIKAKWLAQNPNETTPSNWTQTWPFRNEMKIGDIVIVPYGNSKFRAVAEITGDYRFETSAGGHYAHRRNVRWLLTLDEPLPLNTFIDGNFTMRALHSVKAKHVNLPALARLIVGDNSAAKVGEGLPDQFVLIIDEINRANVSKVFGELITLIEKDKRLGMRPNELTLTLPYSKEPKFGVPCNLHIIGTMNTADRSIAPLDTALRRRFTFLEMAPNPDLLEVAKEETGINLVGILGTINDRIEYLIDRDHRIGHAFFMGCTTKEQVDAVMRDSVIPLLQEYFFEDWRRIASVLGGGFIGFKKLADPMGKDPDRYRWFIRENFADDAYTRLLVQKSTEEIPEEINVEPNQL